MEIVSVATAVGWSKFIPCGSSVWSYLLQFWRSLVHALLSHILIDTCCLATCVMTLDSAYSLKKTSNCGLSVATGDKWFVSVERLLVFFMFHTTKAKPSVCHVYRWHRTQVQLAIVVLVRNRVCTRFWYRDVPLVCRSYFGNLFVRRFLLRASSHQTVFFNSLEILAHRSLICAVCNRQLSSQWPHHVIVHLCFRRLHAALARLMHSSKVNGIEALWAVQEGYVNRSAN